ncbi:MAG: hypothetical protein U9N09_08305 [Euryarchaeota archaeon]|nr:hypothetical protein [Euryarchaeota archaeon]
MLRLTDCPYSDVLADLCPLDAICECHLAGTVHAIGRKSAINRRKKMCAGDPYCEFVIE